MNIKGQFSVTSWDEIPQQEFDDESKITRATVKQTYAGEINGESSIEYIMYYSTKSAATFVGIEYYSGSVAGKTGSLVIEHNGKFTNGVASSEFIIIDGKDELHATQGKGRFTTIGHAAAEYEIEVT